MTLFPSPSAAPTTCHMHQGASAIPSCDRASAALRPDLLVRQATVPLPDVSAGSPPPLAAWSPRHSPSAAPPPTRAKGTFPVHRCRLQPNKGSTDDCCLGVQRQRRAALASNPVSNPLLCLSSNYMIIKSQESSRVKNLSYEESFLHKLNKISSSSSRHIDT